MKEINHLMKEINLSFNHLMKEINLSFNHLMKEINLSNLIFRLII